MLRSHKKNILIGLLAIVVFGLVYGFLSSRPEMIVDESLRVSDESHPELDQVIARSSAFKSPVSASNGDADSRLEGDGMGGEELVSMMQDSLEPKKTLVADASDIDVAVVEEDVIEPLQETVVVVRTDELPDDQEIDQVAPLKDPFVNPFKSGARRFTPEVVTQDNVATSGAVKQVPLREPLINPSNSDVALISEQSGFLDLNLTDTKPLDVFLLEGDEIIIDDVNEALGKYIPSTKDINELSDAADQSLGGAIDDGDMEANISSPVVLSENGKMQDQSSELLILPDVDQKLMNGTDAVSLEYQASYKKLKSITERLKEANEENKYLKNQFSQVAEDNNKLAQIIRDIDEEIKVLTVKN